MNDDDTTKTTKKNIKMVDFFPEEKIIVIAGSILLATTLISTLASVSPTHGLVPVFALGPSLATSTKEQFFQWALFAGTLVVMGLLAYTRLTATQK